MINLDEAPKIAGAVFAIVFGVMLVTSGLTLEQLKAPWRYFINMDTATLVFIIPVAVWAVVALVIRLWFGW